MKDSAEFMDTLVDKLKQAGSAVDKILNGAEKQLVLEVGNHATKMVEYVVKKNVIQVVNGFVINTPINVIENDRIVEINVLTNALRQAINQAKIRTKEFTVSIVSKDIIIREMDIPKMQDKDLRSFVQINSRDIFPVNLSNYILGYSMIEKGEKNRIMIAAIPKSIVSSYIDLGDKLGLTLKGINYSGYELYNFLNYEILRTSEAYLAVDIGARNTNAIVISNGILKFNKIIPKGFGETTQYIAEELNCTVSKAEQLKRQYNAIDIPENLKPDDEEYIVVKYTKRAVDNVMQDIARVIEFYNSNNPKNKINKIYIIGMVGKLKGVEDYFYKKVGIKTKALRVLQKIDFNKNSMHLKARQLNFINCLGAAKLQDRNFVFLKDDLKIQGRSFVTTPKFHKLMACLIALTVFYLVTIKFSTDELNKKIDTYNEFISSKSDLITLQNQVSAKESELKNATDVIEKIGYGAENSLEAMRIFEDSADETSNGAIINVLRYKFTKTIAKTTTKNTNSSGNLSNNGTLEIRCSLILPDGVDSNSLVYVNLPYNLRDKMIEKGCNVTVTNSDNIFTLKVTL